METMVTVDLVLIGAGCVTVLAQWAPRHARAVGAARAAAGRGGALMTTDERHPLSPFWRQRLADSGHTCDATGCDGPVTHQRMWRTHGMPATAFTYLCATHATERAGEGKEHR